MAALVNFDQAQLHMKGALMESEREDVERKLAHATSLVMRFCELDAEDEDWSDETEPADDDRFALVQMAILDAFTNLHRFRGDDEKPFEGPLTRRIRDTLIAGGLADPTCG